ncbi:MAG: hypothetical protein HY744_08990 [Deltaproteobacteria bacterium]|nr:hypothetical protein [Deltaproteobacteria bacterium]
MRALRLLALFVPSAALVAACVLEGFNRVEGGPMDGGTGLPTDGAAGTDGGGGGQVACVSAGPPDAPDAAEAGGSAKFVLAVRKVLVIEQSDGGVLGVDVDRMCTCHGEGSSCKPALGAGDASVCDDPEGRDNALQGLFGIIQLAMPDKDLSELYSERADAGEWSVLMRVSGYNAQENDSEVQVTSYVTTGLNPHGLGPYPLWDGTDKWPISAACLDAGPDGAPSTDYPLYTTDFAYVSDRMLVASLPKSEMVFAGTVARIGLVITGGLVMGRLSPSPTGWRLTDGIIAGRVAIKDLFRAISGYRDEDGNALCMSSPFYDSVRNSLCKAVDTLEDLGGSPSQPCDSLSMAIGFEAQSAMLGTIMPPPDGGAGCTPDADPINDSCLLVPADAGGDG